MSNILVFVEQLDGAPKGSAKELLTTARKHAAGGQVHAAVFGPGANAAAGALGAEGADVVHASEHDLLANYSSQGYATALAQVAEKVGADVLLASASPAVRDFLPRVALKLGGGLASDVTELEVGDGGLVAKRPLYAGKIIATAKITAKPQMFTLRPNAFGAEGAAAGAGDVQAFEPTLDAGAIGAKVTQVERKASERPDLQAANVIVSGGRAMGSEDNFKVLEPLADALGAAIGASRAAVDSGFAPHEIQVGQTGKVVNPNLYIACGISGAIQHLAGMRTSKVIVAVNKDPEAPIFQHATYGIVADLFEAVPLLEAEIKKVVG